MTAPEIITGPRRCRLILTTEAAGYSVGFDAEGDAAWVSFPVGLQVHPSRSAAISAAARQIRAGLSSRITPPVDAWLRSIAPAQGDLFGAVAA